MTPRCFVAMTCTFAAAAAFLTFVFGGSMVYYGFSSCERLAVLNGLHLEVLMEIFGLAAWMAEKDCVVQGALALEAKDWN